MQWDDLKFVLALNRTGTLVGAGRLLNVNTSTVGRRILALEKALGTRLYQRRAGGYHPTPAARRVAACAEEMELQANARITGNITYRQLRMDCGATVDGRLERSALPGYDQARRRGRFSRLFSSAGILMPGHWQIFQSLWDGGLAGAGEVLAAVRQLPRL